MAEIKRTLREWRAYIDFNKQEMAKALKIHPSTYANWEEHPEDIKMRDAARIAELLKCEVSQIIFFESKPSLKLGKAKRIS